MGRKKIQISRITDERNRQVRVVGQFLTIYPPFLIFCTHFPNHPITYINTSFKRRFVGWLSVSIDLTPTDQPTNRQRQETHINRLKDVLIWLRTAYPFFPHPHSILATHAIVTPQTRSPVPGHVISIQLCKVN